MEPLARALRGLGLGGGVWPLLGRLSPQGRCFTKSRGFIGLIAFFFFLIGLIALWTAHPAPCGSQTGFRGLGRELTTSSSPP